MMLAYGFNEAIFFTGDKCTVSGLFWLTCEFMMLFGIVKVQNNAMQPVKPKKKKVDVHFQVEADYAPCCKRNWSRPACKAHIIELRNEGKKNMDLWLDGSIYPPDPTSSQSPSFFGLTSFFKFVCEGENGLLGYCKRLFGQCQSVIQCNFERQLIDRDARIKMLEGANFYLASITTALQASYEDKARVCSGLQKEIDHLQQTIRKMQATIEEKNERLAVREINNFTLESENADLRKQLEKFNKKLQYLKDTPLGARLRKRQFKPLEELNVGGGQWKRRVKACRYYGIHNFCEHSLFIFIFSSFFGDGRLGVGGGIVR